MNERHQIRCEGPSLKPHLILQKRPRNPKIHPTQKAKTRKPKFIPIDFVVVVQYKV